MLLDSTRQPSLFFLPGIVFLLLLFETPLVQTLSLLIGCTCSALPSPPPGPSLPQPMGLYSRHRHPGEFPLSFVLETHVSSQNRVSPGYWTWISDSILTFPPVPKLDLSQKIASFVLWPNMGRSSFPILFRQMLKYLFRESFSLYPSKSLSPYSSHLFWELITTCHNICGFIVLFLFPPLKHKSRENSHFVLFTS